MPPSNPSFWVALQSDAPTAGFPQTLRHTRACMRPSIDVDIYVNATHTRRDQHLREQNLTTDNHSDTATSVFAHVGEAGPCAQVA